MMYVGVDVHKKVCRAAVVNEEGELVDEFSFANSEKGVECFMMKLEAFKDSVLVAVEFTANLWVNDERVRLLMTMPGLDYFAASLLIAEICGINRFSNDKRLVA